LLNFGAIFSRGLGRFAPQKRYHITAARESHVGAMCPLLKGKICATEIKCLLKNI
jgi:hypothetical protein